MTDTIKNFPNRLHRMTQVFYREVPSQVAARRFVDSLANLLFPVRDRRGMSLKEMDLRWENLQQDFLHIITPLCSGMDCFLQSIILEAQTQFQSTLPVRGATRPYRYSAVIGGISIHAPRKGSDGTCGRYSLQPVDFNPRSP